MPGHCVIWQTCKNLGHSGQQTQPGPFPRHENGENQHKWRLSCATLELMFVPPRLSTGCFILCFVQPWPALRLCLRRTERRLEGLGHQWCLSRYGLLSAGNHPGVFISDSFLGGFLQFLRCLVIVSVWWWPRGHRDLGLQPGQRWTSPKASVASSLNWEPLEARQPALMGKELLI